MSSKDDQSDLGVYLSELYKNLNLISSQLEHIVDEQTGEVSELDNKTIELMEKRFSEWMGSFYNILIYLFCSSIAFLTAIVQIDFRFIPITMMILFPFYLWLTFLYSIPEIRVNNHVILSRKDLTLRKQIELARSLFIFFIRQLIDNSKIGIIVMAIYVGFLGIVIVDEFVITLY